ncbi:hypothetical protein [Nonomuraea dietziae]
MDAATAPATPQPSAGAQTHGHHHPDRSSQQQRSDTRAQHHSGPWGRPRP